MEIRELSIASIDAIEQQLTEQDVKKLLKNINRKKFTTNDVGKLFGDNKMSSYEQIWTYLSLPNKITGVAMHLESLKGKGQWRFITDDEYFLEQTKKENGGNYENIL